MKTKLKDFLTEKEWVGLDQPIDPYGEEDWNNNNVNQPDPEGRAKRIQQVVDKYKDKFDSSIEIEKFVEDFPTYGSYNDFLIDEYIDAYGMEGNNIPRGDGAFMDNEEILDRACGDFEAELLTHDIFNEKLDFGQWCDFFNELSGAGW